MKRTVKLGRTILVPLVAQHWAIKVGDTWYEISIGSHKTASISRNTGYAASSGAGELGGEIVGVTEKTDSEIDRWINAWHAQHDSYELLSENCQKFAFEFMVWLTDGNYKCDHRPDAREVLTTDSEFINNKGFARAEDGNAIASYGLGQGQASAGPFNLGAKVGQFNAQAVAGPGFGAFADADLVRVEASLGNIVGAHAGLNANTGVGARNGNVEAHLLGFGGKIGADGLEVNTPIGGVNCSIM